MASENINPWLQMWVHPKKTIRAIIESDPRRVIIWLAIIGGILSSFGWLGYMWITQPDRAEFKNVFIFLIALVVGGGIGLAHLYIAGWLYKLTGSWLGGSGSYIEVKCVVGWVQFPLIIANILGLISVFVVPNPWLQLLFGFIEVVVFVWGVVIFLNMLGEVHRFSAWRALLAVMITLVLVLVAVMLVALLGPLLAPLFN